jgi:hypothetical protein
MACSTTITILSWATALASRSFVFPQVREHIHFNPTVYGIIEQAYDETFFRDQKEKSQPVYLLGPDRVNHKAPGSTDMEIHLDRSLTNNKAPFYPFRLQSFLVLRTATGLRSGTGNLYLIPKFHRFWPLARIFFKDLKGGDSVPQQLGKAFLDRLSSFRDWLDKIAKASDEELDQETKTARAACPMNEPIPAFQIVHPRVAAGSLVGRGETPLTPFFFCSGHLERHGATCQSSQQERNHPHRFLHHATAALLLATRHAHTARSLSRQGQVASCRRATARHCVG